MLKILKLYWIPILAGICLVLGVFFNILGYQDIGNNIFIFSIVIGGIPLIIRTLSELFHGKFSIDLIAIISIVGSLIVPEYLAGAIIVLMLSGGEALENYAQRRARSALQHLLEISPKLAHKKNSTNQEFIDIPIEELRIGDIILIKENEIIPIDATIISGTSEIDQSNLTGESLPVEKTVGEQILSGTTNMSGILTAVVIKESKDSAFTQIINLISNAEKNKAKINRLADRYGALFTPAVLIIAAVVFFFSRNLTFTYGVFVIATPCPLILATPVAIISAIAKSAKRGVIVKNGEALEALAESDALIFDKTGTLTNGTPKVIEFKSIDSDFTDKQIINIAGILNQYSTHILAQSIVTAADNNEIVNHKVENFTDLVGKGVKGNIDGELFHIASFSTLKNLQIEFNPDIEKIKEKSNDDGNIISFVTDSQKVIGYIVLTDTLRINAKNVVSDLRKLSFKKLVLATGDTTKIANKIADEVGIKTVYSEIKPEGKAEIVSKLNIEGYTVAMIGDGVNDAPAMALSNVGIAMGARGSTIAAEASDIIILANDIHKLIDVIIISKKSLLIAKQGIIFGMVCSFIGMFFAGIGILSPVIGALLQEVIDVITIFNALRVLKIKL